MNFQSLIDFFGLRDPGKPIAYGWARIAIYLFLLALPFGHNAAVKNIAMLVMAFSAIWLIRCRLLEIDWRSPIFHGLAVLLLVLMITAGLGIDSGDSFVELRKHFLPGVLMFLLIPTVFRGEPAIRRLLVVAALAFAIRAGLTVLELAYYFPDVNAGRSDGNFIKGFSLDAGFYIPILLGLLLLQARWRWLTVCCLLATLAVMLLVQSRAPVAAAIVAVVAMLFLLRKWRLLSASLLIVSTAAIYVGITHLDIAQRFSLAVSPQTYIQAIDTRNYKQGDGFSGRTPIWYGLIEITAPRPWTGYGFGWKKLGPIAVSDGFVARWQAQAEDSFATEKAKYFSQQASTVNPHNLYLQIYFESGLLGLAAYLLFLCILLFQSARLAWVGNAFNRVLGAVVFAYLIDHIVLGMFNGLLIGLGPSLALIALLEAARRSEIRP